MNFVAAGHLCRTESEIERVIVLPAKMEYTKPLGPKLCHSHTKSHTMDGAEMLDIYIYTIQAQQSANHGKKLQREATL